MLIKQLWLTKKPLKTSISENDICIGICVMNEAMKFRFNTFIQRKLNNNRDRNIN